MRGATVPKDVANRSGTVVGSIRVLIVEDHALIAEGLRSLLLADGDFLPNVASDEEAACARAGELPPDVVLLSATLGPEDGTQLAGELKRLAPDAKVLVLADRADESAPIRAIRHGCDGVVLKQDWPRKIIAAARTIHHGDLVFSPDHIALAMRELRNDDRPAALTDRELEVLRLVAKGLSTDDIADELDLSVNTARTHMRKIFEKLRVHSKTQAVAHALREGLLDTADITSTSRGRDD